MIKDSTLNVIETLYARLFILALALELADMQSVYAMQTAFEEGKASCYQELINMHNDIVALRKRVNHILDSEI